MTMIALYLLTYMNRFPLSELASLNSASLSSVASTLKHLVLSNNRLEKVRDCVNTGFTGFEGVLCFCVYMLNTSSVLFNVLIQPDLLQLNILRWQMCFKLCLKKAII